MSLSLLLALGVVAGTISGVVGFGSSIMLMPVLVVMYGPRVAVPVMAVAATMANLSRVLVWWREVDWRACGVYSLTGIPAAALGARTLLTIPERWAEGVLGLFFLCMVPARRWMVAHGLRIGLAHLAIVGAVIGFLTGIVVSTGPINAPFFLAYGLVKGAYVGTEALGSLAVYVSKVWVFRSFGALPLATVLAGLAVGASLMAGSFLAKGLVQRLDPQRFYVLMEGLLLLSGVTLLWAAFV